MRLIPSRVALTVVMAVAAAPMVVQAYSEAPGLDKLVQDKKLDPVDKRLPEKPEVITPVEKSGKYGGTLRTAMRSNNDHNAILRVIGNQGLTRWTMDFNGVVPNVAESWTLSPDGTEYTFKLRKGMRWSDGAPFTADDILFSMNDLIGNKDFFKQPPSQYVVKDKLVETAKVDDYTVKMKFAGPNLSFVEQLSTPLGQHPTFYAKHYCSKFHPKYNPKVADEVKAAGTQDWPALMRVKCGDIEVPTRWGNPERPVLDPWVIKEPYGGSATKVVLERNPYFWQVDKEGKQLPYLDRVQFSIISEVETIVLAAINGQLDWQHRHVFPIQNRPILVDNATKGGYKVMNLASLNANTVGLWLNWTSKNPEIRKLIRSKDFRIALSLGTDRREVNDIVYLGQAQPWQIGPIKESKWFNEKLGTQYLNYDVKQANQLLDGLGLTKRDADGYRLLPDGKRVALNVIVAIQLSQQLEALEVMRKQWAKIGVDLVIQSSERSLFYQRAEANDYDISVDVVPGGMDATANPRGYVAVHPLESRMSIPWVKWFQSNGKQGEEPTESMKKRLDLYEKWQQAKTQPEADKLFREILQLAADEFEIIGVLKPPADLAVRSDKLINVFAKMPAGWTYPTPGPSLVQQWSFK